MITPTDTLNPTLLHRFDEMRPYDDSELPAAMRRITDNVSFPMLAKFIYPDESIDTVRKRLLGYTSVRDFQHETMIEMNHRIVESCTDGLTYNGTGYLDPAKAYLYVSNHRDIMLDSSLLQMVLVENGFETTQITFGANLMMTPLIVDIGKCNRMFKVERPGRNVREFYRHSMLLSEYIRHTLTVGHESVWIAQRNGRTKDGDDRTDQGIIKMFCMSNDADKVKSINELNIVPVAVSYEWETCDILKTLELYQSRFSRYTKKPFEDLTSILTGVCQDKGRVNIEICEPLGDVEVAGMEGLTAGEFHKRIASVIDRRIHRAYRLFPNNYIAYDIRYGTARFSGKYTQAQREAFLARVRRLAEYDTCDYDQLVDIFLGIYANPVENKLLKAETD